ncbi:MAG: hypothetical protein J5767_12560 [Paludibacteraceae bacterium]|nr:hypothetical protein [Paludibacteraceae bacterium]
MKKTFEVLIKETQRKTIFIETDDDIEWNEVHSWVSKAYQKGQVALTSLQYEDDDTCVDVNEKHNPKECTIRLSRNGDTLESSMLSKTNQTDDMLDRFKKLRSEIIDYIASSYPNKKFEDDNKPVLVLSHMCNPIMELKVIEGEPMVVYEDDIIEPLEVLSMDELYIILTALSN